MTEQKMTVEIWSDVACPFCYMGKRKFELALEEFEDRDRIRVEWKSFQLQPDMETDTTIRIHDYLAQAKGFPVEEARRMNEQVTEAGRRVGLTYHFDQVVVANTFKAHNLLQVAKRQNLQNETEEALFKAYFTEGKNIDDIPTLIGIGKEAGLDVEGLEEILETEAFGPQARADMEEARQMGVRGVPFFVLNRKYGVSGAQEPTVFLQALQTAFSEWRKDNPQIEVIAKGQNCDTDGQCD